MRGYLLETFSITLEEKKKKNKPQPTEAYLDVFPKNQDKGLDWKETKEKKNTHTMLHLIPKQGLIKRRTSAFTYWYNINIYIYIFKFNWYFLQM